MMPLFDIQLPANAGYQFNVLYQVAAFDLFEVGPIYDALFGLEPTDPINVNFDTLGFETTSFVGNIGPLIIVYVVFACFMIGLALLYSCKKFARIARMRARFAKKVLWNPVLQLLNKTYWIVLMSALISLQSLRWQQFGTVLDSLLGIMFVVITIGLPVFLYVLWTKKFEDLDEEEVRERFGSFYENINTDEKSNVLVPLYFYIRRIILSFTVIYFRDHLFL